MLIEEIIETGPAKTKKDAEKNLAYRIGRGISRFLKRDPDYDAYDQRDKEVKISTRTGAPYHPAPKSTQSSIYSPVDMEKIRTELGARYGVDPAYVLHYSIADEPEMLDYLKKNDPDRYKKVLKFQKDFPPVFDRLGDVVKKEDVNEAYEIEFVCVNPNFCDATEQKNQDALFDALRSVPGIIVYKQDFDVHNSMAAIIKNEDDKNAPAKIQQLAKQHGVGIDLENDVSQSMIDDIVTNRLEGLTDYYDTDLTEDLRAWFGKGKKGGAGGGGWDRYLSLIHI